MTQTPVRNHNLDALKLCCALLVIMLHVPPVYKMHDLLLPLMRCAVPIFFMISGYMLYDGRTMDARRLGRSAVRIVRLLVVGVAVYIVAALLWGQVPADSLTLIPSNFKYFFALGYYIPAFHLWYLHAYLVLLLIAMFVSKRGLWRWFICLGLVLAVVSIAVSEAYPAVSGHQVKWFYISNIAMSGIPFFVAGVLVKKYASVLIRPDLSKWYWLGTAVFLIMGIVENDWIKSVADFGSVLYLSSIGLAACVLLGCLSAGPGRETVLSRMGAADSLYIYMLHILPVRYVLPHIIKHFDGRAEVIVLSLSPLIVFTLTVGLTHLLRVCGIIERRTGRKSTFSDAKTIKY